LFFAAPERGRAARAAQGKEQRDRRQGRCRPRNRWS